MRSSARIHRLYAAQTENARHNRKKAGWAVPARSACLERRRTCVSLTRQKDVRLPRLFLTRPPVRKKKKWRIRTNILPLLRKSGLNTLTHESRFYLQNISLSIKGPKAIIVMVSNHKHSLFLVYILNNSILGD